jgi:hypothetical protein
MAQAQIGEKQSALDHIEQSLAIPPGHAVSRASLRFDPVWDAIRAEPMGIERDRLRGAQVQRPSERERTSQTTRDSRKSSPATSQRRSTNSCYLNELFLKGSPPV